jgi:hypothetical protein
MVIFVNRVAVDQKQLLQLLVYRNIEAYCFPGKEVFIREEYIGLKPPGGQRSIPEIF